MYHPTTRLLTILELLQTYPQLSGNDLARRLEVEPRTVRRYVQMLQDMGIPIEGARGPGGGYRLRPGFKLPPLLFTDTEALAVALGLLAAPWLEIDLPPAAVEGALAKMYRVLPLDTRSQIQTLATNLIMSPQRRDIRPPLELLVQINTAVQEQRRLHIEYSSHHAQTSEREIEPYTVVGWQGQWYVVAFCVLRQEPRLFRLDRIRAGRLLEERFTPLTDFDSHEFVRRRLAYIPDTWAIEIEFQAPLHLVQHKIAARFGRLEQIGAGVRLHTHHSSLPAFATWLVGLELPFVIHQPPELRMALAALAERLQRIATTVPAEAPHQGDVYANH